MVSFNRDGKRPGGGFNRGGFGGGKSFGGGSRFGGRDGGRPTMHKATCSECGASCELPFKPTGERPVYCSNCFDKQGGGARPNKFAGDRRDSPRFEDKQMHSTVCAKCGKTCQVPFKPMAGKPAFCNDCFVKGGSGGGKDSGDVMGQLKMLNAKIDKLIAVLSPNAPAVKKDKPEIKVEAALGKVEKKEKVKTKTKAAVKKVAAKKKK
jgi:CxxC-x17-CxxC domain-containing protein